MADDEDDDIPEHVKRALKDAQRAMKHVPPPDVLAEYQRHAEEAPRALRSVPADAFAQHARTMDDMRRALGGLPRAFLDQQQQMARTLAAIRDAAEPQYLRMLREMSEAQRRVLGSESAASLSMVWAAQVSKMQPAWLGAMLASHKLLTDLLGDTLSTRVLTSLFPTLEVQAALASTPSQVLSQLASRHVALATMIGADWMRRLAAQPAFPETFGGRVLHSLEEIARARDDAARDAEIDSLHRLLQERERTLPRTGLSRDAWAQIIVAVVQILVALILYVRQSHDAARDTDRIIAAIHDNPPVIAGQDVQQAVPQLRQWCEHLFHGAGGVLSDAPVTSGPLYVATRRVNVRLSRSVRSPRLVLLHPGQAVERVEKRRKWVHVRYFDFVAGEQRDGWVFSKYLRPIEGHERRMR